VGKNKVITWPNSLSLSF